jgi:lipopolysaccharide exporter
VTIRGEAAGDPLGPVDDEAPTGRASTMQGEDLARAGARGVAWQGGAFVLGKGVVLVTTVLLARLLAPEQYGLVSLALVLIAYAEAVADAGVAQALVYLKPSRATVRAALLCSLLLGSLLAAVGVLTAPVVGSFFGRPDVVPLVRVLALSLIASGLAAVPEALLRRTLEFRRLTVATVVRSLVTGAVAVGLALDGYGAWALVWGTIAGSVSYCVLLWLLHPRSAWTEPSPPLRRALRAVLAYGAPVAGANLLAKLIFDVDYLVVGHRLGAEALGYYTLAFRLPEFLIINVFFVISSVAFPLYSRARDDPARLRTGYLFSVRLQSLYGVCAGVGIAVVAPLLVLVVFGEAWRGATQALVALALYAACRSLGAGANDVYKALGRPGLSVTLSLVRLAVLVPALILGSRAGIEGVAWAQAITSLCFVFLMQGLACRMLQLRPRQLLASAAPALVSGVAVAAVALPLTLVPLPPVAALALAVLGGVAAVSAVLGVGFRPLLHELLRLAGRTDPAAGRRAHTS